VHRKRGTRRSICTLSTRELSFIYPAAALRTLAGCFVVRFCFAYAIGRSGGIFMTSSGFATLLIVGIVFFVTGIGGWIALGLMASGGIGLVVSVFRGKK